MNISSKARIVLVSTFHLANNPRLVKQANALSAAGYNVDVFAVKNVSWADSGDERVLKGASWNVHFIDYNQSREPRLFWYSRLRKKAAQLIWRLLGRYTPLKWSEWIAFRGLERVFPEMYAVVSKQPYDLYIAHGISALPIAVKCAVNNGAIAGFDSADFHPGMVDSASTLSCEEKIAMFVERRYIGRAKQVTASSAGVVEALQNYYRGVCATPILNVFSLRERPAVLRTCLQSEPITLCWFSQTIGRDRGLNDVVEACALLPPQSVELHLRGVWAAGYEAEFRRMWGQKVGDRAKLLVHDPVPPTELIKAVAQFDVGLALETPVSQNRLICMRDLCTNKVFSYLLAGLAIAASGIEGRSSIFDGAGFAYKTTEPQQLAEGIHRWILDRRALNQARATAWRLAETRYNWDIEQQKFIGAVKNTLRRKRVSAREEA